MNWNWQIVVGVVLLIIGLWVSPSDTSRPDEPIRRWPPIVLLVALGLLLAGLLRIAHAS